ncbi:MULTISPECIES: autotransporter outer membrane beta-barrel domain-containing protein [unclassified Pseudomonas]|uniref:autotransporter outer membrane beta-barrel domain-containing protein n=1 Tax=unclassified Pseudomonas TaxID=196821 RepID=UPI001F5ABDBE|nr:MULTISPECIES: autotransporter outer membrane beta-barrel domain-containing protein [unclassified Pseudomonas]
MSLAQKQFAKALTLMLVVTAAPFAQAQRDMEHDSDWLNEISLGDLPAVHDRAPPAPGDEFYFVEHATTHNGKQAAIMLDYAIDQLLESGALGKREQDALEHLGSYLGSLAPGNVGAVLEQLAGSQHANLGTATQDSLKQLNANLLSAIRELSGQTREGARVWLNGLGNSGKLDDQRGSAGLQQRTQGLMVGADWSVNPAWRVGVMGAKSGSNLNAKRFKAELESWHLGVYALRQDGPLALRLGAIYSHHDGRNKRSVDVDFLNLRDQLKGKYSAQSQNAFVELGYQLGGAAISIEPFAGLGWQRYHRDSFTEKGGVTALNVGAQTQQNLGSTFGLRLSSLYALGNQMSLTPHLSTRWQHLYGDVSSTVRQSSAWDKRDDFDSGFTLKGTALDRNSLGLRAGLDLALSAQHTLGLTYTADVGSNSRNQGLMGQWAMGF